jgi:hypothetical protein
MFLRRAVSICIILALLVFFCPSRAHAYLDPGTGSYIFQLIIAGIVGLAFLLKVYWKKIKAFFAKLFAKTGKTHADQDSSR